MVGNVFAQHYLELFTRSLEETDRHYYIHLSCRRPERSMEQFYEQLAAIYAPDLRIDRRKCSSSRKVASRKVPQKYTPIHPMFANPHHNL
ncbi:hypothetical protein TNCV_1894811 [Trichonephila clavipes]|nr:hypothetical protein TNCV_1894811 [Trichonephila clavipes]